MNKQTKMLKKIGMSCCAARGGNNTTPTFKSLEKPPCASKRKTPWGLKLPKSSRGDVIYPAEFINKVKKSD